LQKSALFGAALSQWEARLLSRRLDHLAQRLEPVSATRGDGHGNDILSFETSGADRLIEVKTTAYGQ
jgi:hypothetical protein